LVTFSEQPPTMMPLTGSRGPSSESGESMTQFHVHFAQARGAQGVVVLGVGDVRPNFAVAKREEKQL